MKKLHEIKSLDAVQSQFVLKSSTMKKMLNSLIVLGFISTLSCSVMAATDSSGKTNSKQVSIRPSISTGLNIGTHKTVQRNQGTKVDSKSVSQLLMMNLGTGSSGGGDGVLYSDRILYLFPVKYLKLLDLAEYEPSKGTVQEFKSLNPDIKYSNENFKYIKNHVCDSLEMSELECIGLTNKMYELYKYAPEYYALLKKKMLELEWVLVDHNDEIDDEGRIVVDLNETVGKFQLAHRKNGVVSIQRSGWTENYIDKNHNKFYPVTVFVKVATITHEIIYDITQKQGDNDSTRAREANAQLYFSGINKLDQSYELLTGKKIEIKQILLSKEELKWITRHFINKHRYWEDGRRYTFSFINMGKRAAEMNHSIHARATAYQRMRYFLNDLCQYLIYFGQYFDELKLINSMSDIEIGLERTAFFPYTKYHVDFYEMGAWEWEDFISSLSTKFIERYDDGFRSSNVSLGDDAGVFLDQIPSCEGSGEMDIPAKFRNKAFYHVSKVPDIMVNSNGGIFISYYSIFKDKYLSSKNLCKKYQMVEKKDKFRLEIELRDVHPKIFNHRSGHSLKIVQKVNLECRNNVTKCDLSSDHKFIHYGGSSLSGFSGAFGIPGPYEREFISHDLDIKYDDKDIVDLN